MAFEALCPNAGCESAVLSDEFGNEFGGVKDPKSGKQIPLTAAKTMKCGSCDGTFNYGPYPIKESGEQPTNFDEDLLKQTAGEVKAS